MAKKEEGIIEVEAEEPKTEKTTKSKGRNQEERECVNLECDRIDRMVRQGVSCYRIVKE